MASMLEPLAFVELKASGNLPSPRGSALRILELCQRDDMTLPELVQAVQVDPAMVGRLLKMANSATFARSRPVMALTPEVLMSIGVQAVRQLVLAFSLVSGNRQGQCRNFDYDAFWSRSAATGVAMQLVGSSRRAAPPAELFTVGLLANMGRLALAAIHPASYAELLDRSGGRMDAALTALEEHCFGFGHAEVASTMMQDWGLPRPFCDAVLHHENPPPSASPDSRNGKLVHSLRLAAAMADVCLLEAPERPAAYARLQPLADAVEISGSALASLGDRMLADWAEWSRLLEIPLRESTAFSELAKAEAEGPAAEEAAGLSVLLIGRDPREAAQLKTMLEAGGHAVELSAEGREGLVAALDLRPQVVLVDLHAGREDGLDLIRRLRQTELGRSIYVMAITAAAAGPRLDEVLDAGVDDCLEKPVVARLLAMRLRAGRRLIREQQQLRREQEELRRRLLELSIASQHAREEALTDALTGLYNRRHALDRLAQEWCEADRGRRSLAILMLDIDHFKAINDAHGHDVGDVALRAMAEALQATSRQSDVVFRYGGEEFLVIAPDTSRAGGLELAERVRAAVAKLRVPAGAQQLRFTVSVGVAVKDKAIASAERLLKAADEALYRAKQAGRDRVECAR